jgi:hypothetical protein
MIREYLVLKPVWTGTGTRRTLLFEGLGVIETKSLKEAKKEAGERWSITHTVRSTFGINPHHFLWRPLLDARNKSAVSVGTTPIMKISSKGEEFQNLKRVCGHFVQTSDPFLVLDKVTGETVTLDEGFARLVSDFSLIDPVHILLQYDTASC